MEALHDDADFAALAGIIFELNASADLRINVGLRDRKLIMARANVDVGPDDFFSSAIRGKRPEVSVLPCFSAEFDIGQEGHAADAAELPKSREEVFEHLATCGIPPASLEVSSGHGFHLHWCFEPIFLFIDGNDTGITGSVWNRFQKFQQRFTTKESFGDRVFFKIDPTAGIEREWRLPGTNNMKIPERPRPVRLIGNGDLEPYDIDVLAPIKHRITKTDKARIDAVSGNRDIDRLKAHLASRRPDSKNQAEIKLLLDGKSFAPSGKRNSTMQALVGTIVFGGIGALGIDPNLEDIYGLFDSSFQAWEDEPPVSGKESTTVEREREILKDMLERAVAEYIEKQQAAMAAQQADANKDIELSPLGEINTITTEGVTQLCRIVQHKKSFALYSFVEGKFLSRWFEQNEMSILDIDWPNHRADLVVVGENGKSRPRKAEELTRAFGVVAVDVRYSLLINEDYYDEKERAFIRAASPLREDLEPIYSPIIDEFIDKLGGAKADILRDWCAACFRLDGPCAGLYLYGVPGCGKDFFVNGVASIWKRGSPTEYNEFKSKSGFVYFNNPIILIEEEVKDPIGVTSDIRKLVSQQNEHQIKHKFKDPFSMIGSLRLVITANNYDAINEPGVNHTQYDIAAIQERITFIAVNSVVSKPWVEDLHQKLLKEQNGNGPGIGALIESGEFANHVAWLATEREPKRDRFYCMQNELTDWHLHYVLHGSGSDNTLEWITRMATEPALLYQSARGMAIQGGGNLTTSIGGGQIRVRTQEVLDHWKVYMSNIMKPTVLTANRSLDKLAVQDGDGYTVRLDLLRFYVQKSGIGDWDKIEANMRGLALVK
ncbi:MAG: hypothetical protein Q8S00_32410 [Deltaproteobacteria bacterium]|nr:hypothetical protein [Deltaproteobacteria bacterium]